MMISTFPAIVMILHPTVWKFSDVSVDYLVSYVASSPALISLSLSLLYVDDMMQMLCDVSSPPGGLL